MAQAKPRPSRIGAGRRWVLIAVRALAVGMLVTAAGLAGAGPSGAVDDPAPTATTAAQQQANAENCPEGFYFDRLSGTGCVQAKWPPFGHPGYTGSPVCNLGAAVTEWREAEGPIPGNPAMSFPYLCMCDQYDPAQPGDDPEPDAEVRQSCSGLDQLIIDSRVERGLPAPSWAEQGPLVTLPGDGTPTDATEAPATTAPSGRDTGPTATTAPGDQAGSVATTIAPAPEAGTTGSKVKPSKAGAALSGGTAAAVVTLIVSGVKDGTIRGKTGELVKKADEKVKRLDRRRREIADLLADPGGAAQKRLRRKLEKEADRLRRSGRAQRFERRADEIYAKGEKLARTAEKAADKAGMVLEAAADPKGTAEAVALHEAETFLESPRGKRMERRADELMDKYGRARSALADPRRELDKATKRKVQEYVARLRERARQRAGSSQVTRKLRRLSERLSRHTRGILNAQSTVRLIRSMGDPKRFSREVRRNPALVRHVIRRAGLSPLAVEALGGPKSIGRMLGRVARNPGRELRRVGRFLGRPKGWVPEIGRAGRRVVRGIGRLFGIK